MDIARYKTDIIHFLEHEYYVPDTEQLIDFSEWEWQEQILRDIFETKDTENKRLYTAATVSTPRQQGKSLILQCVGLYMLIAGGKNLNIYSIACDKDQAALVPERVKKAIRLNPRLSSAVTITRDVIHCPANGNTWTIMSSDQASAPGIQADVLLWDELGQLPEYAWNLVYLLLPSMSARPQPLLMIASTVGEFEEGPLDSFMALGRDGDGDRYLYETNEIKSPLTKKAQVERDRKLMPEAVWMRHYANTVVQGASFLSDEDIEAIIVPVDGEEGAEGYSDQYIGCDWGLTKDKCAVVSIEKTMDGQYIWDDARLFRGSKQNPVDLNEAADAVRDIYRGARKVVFDKWQAIATIQQLQLEWGEDVVIGFDITQSSRIRLFKNLFTIIRDRQLRIYSDILPGCWKQSCQTCSQNLRCAEQIQHEFLRELQGLQCDSNFKVTHGKRGDDITFATALALFEAVQEDAYVVPKVLGMM